MVTNHKPTVGGDDPAQWRRLRIVPFDVVVANPNKRLKEQLAVELPAVLAWLVAGYREWHHHGLDEPEVVVNATDARIVLAVMRSVGSWTSGAFCRAPQR